MPHSLTCTPGLRRLSLLIITAMVACTHAPRESGQATTQRPEVAIEGNMFVINGSPTYAGRTWQGHKIEGLLMNSRMVQGIFDDEHVDTRILFHYPDTDRWDPERNTDEFIVAMDDWHTHGLNAFTINLQGGSPTGYGNRPWINTAFDPAGNLKEAYMKRLKRILDRAEELSIVVILGYFYFGQDQHVVDEAAVINGTRAATQWVLDRGYRNVIIEINNECDVRAYDHDILKPERVHELIDLVKAMSKDGRRLLVSTSFKGGAIPTTNVIETSDFLLLHGNGVSDPMYIQTMVDSTIRHPAYRNQPVVFNEDDHYDFELDTNNFTVAVRAYASWGYFDYRREGEDMAEGFQSVPVDWTISSGRKRGFFELVREITGFGSR